MSTPGNPSGEPPTTNATDTSGGVKDPHEHRRFPEPTKEVGPKYVAALLFAQPLYSAGAAALIGALVVLPIKKVR